MSSVPMDDRVNIKESEKIDKYLDISRELKKTKNKTKQKQPVEHECGCDINSR